MVLDSANLQCNSLLRNTKSSLRARKQGAASVRITTSGPSKGRISMQRLIKALRRVVWQSLASSVVAVKEVTHSRSTSMSCLARLTKSAAKMMPTASGGALVDCSTMVVGDSWSDAQ